MIVRTKDIDVLINEAIAKWYTDLKLGHLELYQASFTPESPSKGWRDFVRGTGRVVFLVINSPQKIRTYIVHYKNQIIIKVEYSKAFWLEDFIIKDWTVLRFYDALQIANAYTSEIFKWVTMRWTVHYQVKQPFYAFKSDKFYVIVNFDKTVEEIPVEDYEKIEAKLEQE